MDSWIETLDATIASHGLLPDGAAVVVAVSGGLDSICLLHALHRLASQHRWRLVVAHFNHQLRGSESDGDERFVVREAKKLGWRVIVGRGDVKAHAMANGISVEMAARVLRHQFLSSAARRARASQVAVAHHADDQVESFFLRLFRGTGGDGIAGMRWSSPSPVDARIRLIRPFLKDTRQALHEWAESEHLKWREDSSNASIQFQRNRIRHRLLPSIKREFGDGFQSRLLRLTDLLAEEADYLSRLAIEWVSNPDRPAYSKLPVAMQRRTLQCQLLRLGTAVDFDLIEGLRLRPDVTISVGKDQWVTRTPAGIVEEIKGGHGPFQPDALQIDLAKNRGGMAFRGIFFIWRISSEHGSGFSPREMTEYFDAEKVGLMVTLRHWQPGDRYQPIGLKSARKLQDILGDLKIPREHRRRLVLAAAQNGEIFWVEGLRISDRFKLDMGTRRRLKWTWRAAVGHSVAGSDDQ
ncbi:MAG: tRNA lysidine(34) synthetase TilS [Opitutaceae bacterium]|nr:tRNA lysidine(34) synthetase TilS [Verrucomicrobiales bacterium]